MVEGHFKIFVVKEGVRLSRIVIYHYRNFSTNLSAKLIVIHIFV